MAVCQAWVVRFVQPSRGIGDSRLAFGQNAPNLLLVKFYPSIAACCLFASIGFAPARVAASEADNPLEFRGVIDMDNKVTVGLFDRNTGQSFWVAANGGTAKGVTVKTYDPKHDQVTVDYNGHNYVLTLASAVILVAPPEPPPSDTPAADGTATASAAQGGGEVERRQSLRQVEVANQAVQQQQQPPPPAAPATTTAP